MSLKKTDSKKNFFARHKGKIFASLFAVTAMAGLLAWLDSRTTRADELLEEDRQTTTDKYYE